MQTMSTMSRCMTFGQTIATNFRRSVFWLCERKGHALYERKIKYGLNRLSCKGPFSAKEWRSSVNVTKLKLTIRAIFPRIKLSFTSLFSGFAGSRQGYQHKLGNCQAMPEILHAQGKDRKYDINKIP